jgi:hypothetical protein
LRIERLQIVDGDQNPAVRRQSTQHGQEPDRDRAGIAPCAGRLGAEQRRLQRRALRRRQPRQRLGLETIAQVDQAREGQTGLARARSRDQDAGVLCAGRFDRCLPQRGLPDPCATDQDHRAGSALASHGVINRAQFGVSSYDRRHASARL